MTSIKRTGPQPQTSSTQRRQISSCGPTTPTERAVSSCGGWVSKASRSKTEKSGKTEKPQKKTATACGGWSASKKSTVASACGGSGWSRYGKIPSGC